MKRRRLVAKQHHRAVNVPHLAEVLPFDNTKIPKM